MEPPSPLIPARLVSRLINDDELAGAYQSLTPRERSWLKTCIAVLYQVYGPDRPREFTRRARLSAFTLTSGQDPLPWAMVRLSPRQSPSWLLAALVPIILDSISDILVVITDQTGPAPALLCALELAGQENILGLPAAEFDGLLKYNLKKNGPGLLVNLDTPEDIPETLAAAGLRVWRPRPLESCGVWCDGQTVWDWMALRASLPGQVIDIWGRPERGSLPDDLFVRRRGDLDKFLTHGYQVVYGPAEALPLALERAELAFGPGYEGCWLWPDITPGLFASRRLAVG